MEYAVEELVKTKLLEIKSLTRAVPFTSNLYAGVAVPTPTLLSVDINNVEVAVSELLAEA